MKTLSKIALLLGSVAIVGCAGDNPTPGDGDGDGDGDGNGEHTGENGGGEFEHPDLNPTDNYDYSGAPATYLAATHSCAAINYDNLGGLLASRGVDLNNGTNLSAGQLYTDGDTALGVSSYENRVREPLELSTAQTAKMYDIFIAAAPEIIASMAAGTVTACDSLGAGINMFEGDSCTIAGLQCITGMRATASALALCNNAVTSGATTLDGQHIAVAAAMAAAHTCE